MPSDLQYLQTQINDLQVSIEAHKALVVSATENAGENKKILKALHERLDETNANLSKVNGQTITREDFEAMLAISFNKRLASAVKNVSLSLFGLGFAGVVAWVSQHFVWK